MKLTAKQRVLLEFVKDQHGDQKRKYTHEPYWNHVYHVAEIVQIYVPEGIEIALCHDLFEDTQCKMHDLLKFLTSNGYWNNEALFIVSGVNDLTDAYTKEVYPTVNRKERKILESGRLGTIHEISQSVKYADLIDNTKSIVEHDPGFATVYLNEKEQILHIMRDGNVGLLAICESSLQQAKEKLGLIQMMKDDKDSGYYE